MFKMGLGKKPTLVKNISALSDMRQLSRETVKNDRKDEKTHEAVNWSHTSCWPCFDPIFISPRWFSAPPKLPCRRKRDQTLGETLCCVVEVTSRDILDSAAARRLNVAVPEFEKYLRDRDIHGFEDLVNGCLSQLCHACIQYSSQFCVKRPRAGSSGHLRLWLKTIRASGTSLWCRSEGPPRCVPHVGECASQLVPCHPGRIQTSVPRAWLHNVQQFTLLLSFHCLVHPAEGRQLPCCDLETFDGFFLYFL